VNLHAFSLDCFSRWRRPGAEESSKQTTFSSGGTVESNEFPHRM
jgi:hypothetical protein